MGKVQGGTGTVTDTSEPHCNHGATLRQPPQGTRLAARTLPPSPGLHKSLTAVCTELTESYVNTPLAPCSILVPCSDPLFSRQHSQSNGAWHPPFTEGEVSHQEQWVSKKAWGLCSEHLPGTEKNPHGLKSPLWHLPALPPADKSLPFLNCGFLICSLLTETIPIPRLQKRVWNVVPMTLNCKYLIA